MNKFENNENIISLISDYIYLTSLNKNFTGAFLFAYDDEQYNLDVILFSNIENVRIDTIYIENNRIQFINMNEKAIDEFIDEINNTNILYDKDDTLHTKVKRYKGPRVVPSNNIEIDDSFYNDIKNNINYKSTTRLKMYLNIYYTLVDYYKILLTDSKNMSLLKDYFNNRLINLDSDKLELHSNALLDAFNINQEDNNRFLDEERIKLYNKIVNKK